MRWSPRGACGRSVGLFDDELGAFERSLADERVTTARLLEAVAQEERVPLHHRLDGPESDRTTLGLPDGVRACLFDLDGVLTASAEIHAAAWRDSLNDFLSRRLERTGERFGPFRPFSTRRDYYRYLHGKPRVVGAACVPREPRDQAPGGTAGRLRRRGDGVRPREPEDPGLPAPARERRDPRVRGNGSVPRGRARGRHELRRDLREREHRGDAGARGSRAADRPHRRRQRDPEAAASRASRRRTRSSRPAGCSAVEPGEAATFETTVDGLEASRSRRRGLHGRRRSSRPRRRGTAQSCASPEVIAAPSASSPTFARSLAQDPRSS